MDIFFQDPDEIPLPPREVRIRELKVNPWPDGKRLHIYIELDPFQKKPDLELRVVDADGSEKGSVSIIESMTRKMELTMHLQGEAEQGEFLLTATLLFREEEIEDEGKLPKLADPVVMEQVEKRFQIPPVNGL